MDIVSVAQLLNAAKSVKYLLDDSVKNEIVATFVEIAMNRLRRANDLLEEIDESMGQKRNNLLRFQAADHLVLATYDFLSAYKKEKKRFLSDYKKIMQIVDSILYCLFLASKSYMELGEKGMMKKNLRMSANIFYHHYRWHYGHEKTHVGESHDRSIESLYEQYEPLWHEGKGEKLDKAIALEKELIQLFSSCGEKVWERQLDCEVEIFYSYWRFFLAIWVYETVSINWNSRGKIPIWISEEKITEYTNKGSLN